MAEGARVEGGWAEGERVAAGMEEAGWEGETAMGDWGWEAAGCRRDVRGRELDQSAHSTQLREPQA